MRLTPPPPSGAASCSGRIAAFSQTPENHSSDVASEPESECQQRIGQTRFADLSLAAKLAAELAYIFLKSETRRFYAAASICSIFYATNFAQVFDIHNEMSAR
jgi:hypothetical protein